MPAFFLFIMYSVTYNIFCCNFFLLLSGADGLFAIFNILMKVPLIFCFYVPIILSLVLIKVVALVFYLTEVCVFSTTGPQAWNQLPTDIRNTATYATFKHNLKTFLFNIAYGL